MQQFEVGGINTTERCNLSCIICPFNGPDAPRKYRTLDSVLVIKFMREIPKQECLEFSSLGEFFTDPDAVRYLELAKRLGHGTAVLTNGLLLTHELIDQILGAGTRTIRISVDAISSEHYSRIRRGGNFQKVLDACDYLKQKKRDYPSFRVEVNNTLFDDTFSRQDEFIRFWKGKIDQVNFNALYYDIFKFKNLFFQPRKRVDCRLQVSLLPSGQMSPCCGVTVYQHYHNLDWLPCISECTPIEAHNLFQEIYADPNSPLRRICQKCEWWVLWALENGKSPYCRHVPFDRTILKRVSRVFT